MTPCNSFGWLPCSPCRSACGSAPRNAGRSFHGWLTSRVHASSTTCVASFKDIAHAVMSSVFKTPRIPSYGCRASYASEPRNPMLPRHLILCLHSIVPFACACACAAAAKATHRRRQRIRAEGRGKETEGQRTSRMFGPPSTL